MVIRRTSNKAIFEKCKDCIYDPLCGGGTPRQQIGKCTSPNCAIWPTRPGPRDVEIPRDRHTVSEKWLQAHVRTPNLLPYSGGPFEPAPIGMSSYGGE